ncbi:MAG: site-specific DNA-methyltransferase [Chloroflexota bacterium]|nr:site-specific DNA-methyltransferase [Chloroflexota bacterium]
MNNLVSYQRYQQGDKKSELFLGDATYFLKSLDSGIASIVFLDPPFNLGKRYSDNDDLLDNRTPEEYNHWLKEILTESIRVLMKGGALYLYHLPSWAIHFGSFLKTRLTFRHWIAISMKNGFARGNYLYPAHYALLYFTKGEPINFIRPHIKPSTCRHCGGMIKDYGGYQSIINEKGINLSDFWEDLSPVRHSNTKLRSANQLPIKMLQRVIEISGTPGSLYVDPFSGTGTGIIAALELGMYFSACDIVESNCELIHDRIINAGFDFEGDNNV